MYPGVLHQIYFAAEGRGPEPDRKGRVPQENETGIPEEGHSFGMLFCINQPVPEGYGLPGRSRCD